MSGASKQGNEGKPFPTLLPHTTTQTLTQRVEIAKGHTDANATTRLTAAKDAVSDKVDEKKHDVRPIHYYPSPVFMDYPHC